MRKKVSSLERDLCGPETRDETHNGPESRDETRVPTQPYYFKRNLAKITKIFRWNQAQALHEELNDEV